VPYASNPLRTARVVAFSLGVAVAMAAAGLAAILSRDAPREFSPSDAGVSTAGTDQLLPEIKRVGALLERFESDGTQPHGSVQSAADPKELIAAIKGLTELLARLPDALSALPNARSEATTSASNVQQTQALDGMQTMDAGQLSRAHLVWSPREVYRQYGKPDSISYWASPPTVRWTYQRVPGGKTIVFEFLEGMVFQVLVM
jgi:hypothetical protein